MNKSKRERERERERKRKEERKKKKIVKKKIKNLKLSILEYKGLVNNNHIILEYILLNILLNIYY